MFLNKSIFRRVFQISLNILIVNCQLSYQGTLWFASSPIASKSQLDICQGNKGVTLQQCLEPPFQNCCVIYSVQCGLQFSCLNSENHEVNLYSFPAKIQVQQMYIQSKTQNLWVVDANNLYLFQIQNPHLSQIVTKSQIPKQNSGATNSFFYYQGINRLFLVNKLAVDVYDIQNADQINFIFTIPAKSSTSMITIDFNYQASNKQLLFADKCSITLSKAPTLNKITSDLLYVSTQDDIQIYQIKETNYNQILPSVVNIPQIIVYDKFISALQYAYSCQYTPYKNYLLSAKGTEGVYIFKEDPNSHTLLQVQNINPPNFTTNLKLAKIFNKDNNLVIGRDNHLYFYDISDIKNPQQISTLSISTGNQIRSAYITKDLKKIIVAGDSQGVVIVDISNLSAPQIIASKYQDLPISSKCQDLSMDATEQYIYASYNGQGLVIYDVHNFTNPIILSYITTYGGQNIRVFQTKPLIVFADAQFGLKIIDVSQPASPMILVSLRTQGSVKECSIIYNETFLLCTARYRGQLQLIDLRDVKNPNILQVFNYQNIDGGLNICANSDKTVAYLGLATSVIRLNLFPSINFDLDIQLVSEGEIEMNTLLKIGTIFKVGQKIQINLNQVYPSNQAYINNVFYYSDFNMQDLPYWASYSQASQSLILQLDKNSLQTSSANQLNSNQTNQINSTQYDNQLQISQQQFVFSVSQKLSKTDFINSYLSITQQQSQQIFVDCILANLITHDYFVVQTSQEVINDLLQNKYQQNIIDYIFYILSQRNNYYPINFLVESSLQVNIDDESVAPSIQTISSQLQISLDIDSSQGCFIPYQYSGVLIYLNAENTKIQLQGDVASINSVINSGIRIANFVNPQLIKLTITINDSVNYVITKTITASHKYIIKLNQPISNNPSLSLRDDFALKFSNSQLYIMESFSYTFNPEVFLNPDGRALHYTAKIFIKDEYQTLPQQYWLVFQQEQRNFFGSVSSSQFQTVARIMINVTDGYTYAIDYFEMHFDLIPFSYILLYMFQIMSPILGILGLWKYKSLMYNRFRKNNYSTTKIQIQSGNEILLQIPLLGNKVEIAQNIWKSYFKKLNKDQVLKELNQILEQKDMDNHSMSQSKQDMAASTIKCTPVFRKRQETFQKLQNKFTQSYLRSISKVKQNKESPRNQIQKSRKSTISSSLYFNQDGSLNNSFILESVREHYQQNFKEKNFTTEAQLKNSQSMISRAIVGLAAFQFSELHQISQQILSFLKNVALQEGYLEIDWYKKYVQIIAQPKNIHQDQFPIIQFFENCFNQIFQDTFQNCEDREEKKKQSLQLIPFIKQVIEAIALGFTLDGKGMVPKVRGECIETEYHDIKSIRSYRPIQREIYCCFKHNYEELVEKEFHQNQELPSWIQSLDITNSVILIQGKAENKDIGEYVLNLYNKKDFLIKQIRLQISPCTEKQQNLNSNLYLNILSPIMNKSSSQLIPNEEGSPKNSYFVKTIFREDTIQNNNNNTNYFYNEEIEQDQKIQL
ncbi:transmembrane protein, putative (macronuclear) [Tetrahymena thermophila SB210]|uniref:Transmembrane protein, putative n=1 Tax=Tetrahymena thermophila (strain SB210) TaxID=312017 RepID=Q22RM7_TETTS|nr:transmembrane protein, putative [Tetrahymena thermophila SB210]EAR88095.2 transmembrane protein, putative [Tetrahymena thermophila SB210]|eukprot:XP_001008340.2 transmembrane protein, putative [Tetrahymena thermophila SB210]